MVQMNHFISTQTSSVVFDVFVIQHLTPEGEEGDVL